MLNQPNRIILHHSADLYPFSQAARINNYHQEEGFDRSFLGYYGGYHYLVERDGEVFQYRLETEYGQHDAGENINSLGICLAGDFDRELPSAAQETALAALLDTLLTKYQLPIARIEPHRFGDTTHCPGLRLADNWAQIVYLKNKLNWLQQFVLWLSNNYPR